MIKGKQSIAFKASPYIEESASVVGKKEGEGPLGNRFDMVGLDDMFGEDTWEKAESSMHVQRQGKHSPWHRCVWRQDTESGCS